MTPTQLTILSLGLKHAGGKIREAKTEIDQYRDYAKDRLNPADRILGQNAITELNACVADLSNCLIRIHQLRSKIAILQQ